MPDRHPTMMEPPVEDLLDRVDSKFTLVSLAAMRGRQINSYFNQLGEGLGTIVPPQVTSVSRKPLSISLEEIAAGKITYARTDPEGEGESDGEDEEAGSGGGPVEPARSRRTAEVDGAGQPAAHQAQPDEPEDSEEPDDSGVLDDAGEPGDSGDAEAVLLTAPEVEVDQDRQAEVEADDAPGATATAWFREAESGPDGPPASPGPEVALESDDREADAPGSPDAEFEPAPEAGFEEGPEAEFQAEPEPESLPEVGSWPQAESWAEPDAGSEPGFQADRDGFAQPTPATGQPAPATGQDAPWARPSAPVAEDDGPDLSGPAAEVDDDTGPAGQPAGGSVTGPLEAEVDQ